MMHGVSDKNKKGLALIPYYDLLISEYGGVGSRRSSTPNWTETKAC